MQVRKGAKKREESRRRCVKQFPSVRWSVRVEGIH